MTISSATTPAILVRAAFIGPVLTGVFEGARAAAGGGEFVTALLVGLWSWSVFVLPLMACLFVGWWVSRLDHTRHLVEQWSHQPVELVTGLIGIGSASVFTAAMAEWATGFVGDRVRDSDLIAPAVALVTGGAVVGFAVLYFVCWGVIRLGVSTLNPALARCLAVLAGLGGPLYVLFDSATVLAKDIRWDPGLLLLMACALSVGSLFVLRRATASWVTVGVCTALIGSAWWVGPQTYGAERRVQIAFEDSHGWTPLLVNFARARADEDGDGFSPILGGGDCRDDDPNINPIAVDIPGNGLDEDCRDGDREKLVKVPPEQLKRAPLDPKFVKRWNVLLITIDSLRPDHLELHGYERETAPNLSRLAKNGLVFNRAYAPSNATRYSIPPLFAGRLLSDMNVERLGGFLAVGPDNGLLFETLQKNGWQTSAHLPRQLMRGMWLGLNQGFDEFEGHAGAKLKKTSVPALTKAFKAQLDRVDKNSPWAMWVHFIEPHEPYRKHRSYPFGSKPIDRYDAEIRYTDSGIGRMLAQLRKKKMMDNTIIIVTSDHGEEFGEHGRRFHGKQLFEESILVPLVIHIPGAPAVRVEEPVTLIDVPETVAQLVGIKAGADYGGLSLAPALDGWRPPMERPIFVESLKNGGKTRKRKVTMVRGHSKTMLDLTSGKARIFDLKADPGETIDLIGKETPALADDMKRLRGAVDRQEQTVLMQLKGRRISNRPPSFLKRPVRELPGLRYWGGHVDTRVLNGENMLQVRNWFEATGPRKDYRFQLEIVDRKGKVRRKWRYALLSGMYPTIRWKAGEVLEDARLMRFRKLKGTVKLRMAIYDGKKRIAEPVVIGVAKTSDYY